MKFLKIVETYYCRETNNKKCILNKLMNKLDQNNSMKMHLATEVSSTTNHQLSSMDTKPPSNENNNQNKNDSPKTNGYLTAQELAERTIEGLLAEHPGELVKTGSPHIVTIVPFLSTGKI